LQTEVTLWDFKGPSLSMEEDVWNGGYWGYWVRIEQVDR
jgi:hypothetical protein